MKQTSNSKGFKKKEESKEFYPKKPKHAKMKPYNRKKHE